jgi:hypothetical protein
MARSLSFEQSVTTDNPMTAEEFRCAERVLARLIAAAFASDHPELFGDTHRDVHIMGSRPKTPAPSLSGASNQGITTAGENHARIE